MIIGIRHLVNYHSWNSNLSSLKLQVWYNVKLIGPYSEVRFKFKPESKRGLSPV